MIAVAASAIVLGLVIHIQVRRRDEDDFAMPILMLEGIAVSVLLAIVLAVVYVVWVAREDEPRVHR
jgi:xanthine/uracil permease